jgi:hypothetical protein
MLEPVEFSFYGTKLSAPLAGWPLDLPEDVSNSPTSRDLYCSFNGLKKVN